MEALVIYVCREHKRCSRKPNQDASQLSISEANITAFIPLMVTFADRAPPFWSITNLFPAKI